MKLTTKLMGLSALLVIVTGLATAGVVYLLMVQTLQREVIHHLGERSASYLLNIDHMLFERLGDIRVIAMDRLLCDTTFSRQQVTRRLIQYRNTYKSYYSLSYYDSQGARLADSSSLQIGQRDQDLSFIAKNWDRIIRADHTVGTGRSTSLSQNVLYFVKPVQCETDSSPRGVVVARVPLSQLYGLFDQAGTSVEIDLVDRDGLLLYSNHRHDDKAILSDRVEHNDRHDDHACSSDSHIMLVTSEKGYLDYQGQGWKLLLAIPKQVAMAPAIELRNRVMLLSLVGVLLALLPAFWVARYITRPIQSLVHLVREVASGALSLHAIRLQEKTAHPLIRRYQDQARHDEIGILLDSFQHMVIKLDEAMVSKGHVDNIIESMSDLLLVCSLSGRIVRVNRPELFGYDRADMIGQLFSHFLVGSATIFPGSLEKTVASGAINNIETNLIHSDFHRVPVIVSASMLYGEQHQATGIVVVVRDITLFREAQRQLHDKDTRLLAAEMAVQSKSLFLANMSHEIRTPMNAVMGLTHLALQQPLSAKLRDYLTMIANSSQSLLHIINDILDFSKIEAGKLAMEQTDFLLRDVFDRLAALFSTKVYQKRLELVLCAAEECYYYLRGDPIRLEQILVNLVGNAIKFTDAGEVHIQVRTLKESLDQVMLEFSVRDTGMGMDQSQMAGLFAAFSQGDNSITRKYGGTGLGLSISRKLVELMGGQIWVESQPGQGSRFVFTAVFERQLESQEQDLLPPGDLERLRTLVVEDNTTARAALMGLLASFDFAAVGVSSGSDALIAIQQAIDAGTPFQLVLVDWWMPAMDGVATMEAVTTTVAAEHRPKMVLLTAGVEDESLQMRGRVAGAGAFLAKPVNCSRLFDAIMDLFGHGLVKTVRPEKRVVDLNNVMERLSGRRILLVEDNSTNQQVAREMLEQVGVVMQMAQNGLEAVARVAEESFDLVLMDIQMPKMDGLTATRQIRANAMLQHLPIIAMTAHAMAGDREQSLDAGMNDHITKPIDMYRLYETMIRWLPDRGAGLSALTDVSPPVRTDPAADVPPLPANLVGIDLPACLQRFGGNQASVWRVLRTSWQDFNRALTDMRPLLTRQQQPAGTPHNDEDAAARLAHTIKGLAGTLSADGLQQSAQALELALKQQRWQDVEGLLTIFEQQLQQLVNSIGQVIADRPQPATSGQSDTLAPAVALDRQQLQPLLQSLAGFLRRRDFKARAACEQLQLLLQQTVMRPEIEALHTHLERFDFEGARVPLARIFQTLEITDGEA
ncbi:MAG: response regulator [Magnetococcales bacterium]|nr:response regulator [Magnetococcales bacterium]